MLQCKSSEGSADAFVRDVKAAPDPQCVLFFDWQLKDLVPFLTNDKAFGIFTADTTYNLHRSILCYSYNLQALDACRCYNPKTSNNGWSYVSAPEKKISSFNYFANTLVCFNKQLQHIKVFGTDGDKL